MIALNNWLQGAYFSSGSLWQEGSCSVKEVSTKGMLPQKFIAFLNPQNLGTFLIYEQLKQVGGDVGSGFILWLLIYRESAKIWTSKMNLALMVL